VLPEDRHRDGTGHGSGGDREERTVWLWRFEQLVQSGYPELYASMLASDRAVDLGLARRLVAKLACPPELAIRILL